MNVDPRYTVTLGVRYVLVGRSSECAEYQLCAGLLDVHIHRQDSLVLRHRVLYCSLLVLAPSLSTGHGKGSPLLLLRA